MEIVYTSIKTSFFLIVSQLHWIDQVLEVHLEQ